MDWETKLTFSDEDDYKEFVREMRMRYNIPRKIGNYEILPGEGKSRRGGSVSIRALNCHKKLNSTYWGPGYDSRGNEYHGKSVKTYFVKYFDREPIEVEGDTYWCSFRVKGYFYHKDVDWWEPEEDSVNVNEVKLYECTDEESNPIMPPDDIEGYIEDYICYDYDGPLIDDEEY
ncbi:MAG: hypothetical protein J6Y78_09715 [Paludibacteraceae bacterium]|nr:hypothetical protein [Paludibacteraceae bacterium]